EVQIRTEEMHREAEYGITAHVLYKEGDANTPAARSGGAKSSSFDWIKSLMPGFARRNSKGDAHAKPMQEVRGQSVSTKHKRYGTLAGPEWLHELGDEEDDPDFETTLRTDIFSQRVFVFTPTGDVVDLPVRATPIDFAYAIHSDIGDHIFGVKVNNKLVQLDTVLHNGDIVEIQTKKSAEPKQKW